ncbi:MAG: hypothetical protein Q8R70_03095 [Methanoregula sp.]|nr:hypothetical protein [Methanoregula sp.]
MDNDQINYIKHRLQRYEESIKETGDHFDELESFGMYRACAPYYEKFDIPLLIDALKTDDAICDICWQEYDRITGKLNTFDTDKGHLYRDLLYKDLNNYIAAYHSALCYADLDMISVESDHALFNREAIHALLAELHRDSDCGEMENLVRTLDELFLHMRKTAEGTTSKQPVLARGSCTPLKTCGGQVSVCRENGTTRQV